MTGTMSKGTSQAMCKEIRRRQRKGKDMAAMAVPSAASMALTIQPYQYIAGPSSAVSTA